MVKANFNEELTSDDPTVSEVICVGKSSGVGELIEKLVRSNIVVVAPFNI